jgi:outer membrane protein OmpA-like peptidoglycan-associated protein
MAIARSSGAAIFALDTFQKAESDLKQAEAYQSRNAGSKPVTMTARQAVQTAEDARAIAVKRQDEELATAERKAGADREIRADLGRDAAQAETARIAKEAEDARLSATATAARLKTASDETLAVARGDAERLKLANDAERDAAQAEAQRLKLENDATLASARSSLDLAQNGLDRATREKTELRAQLLLQFNAILQTRDTARGLIVNMSDVLFDTARFTLRPEAREKLAKVSGIVAAYPGLRLAVEGYTDSTGSDEYNQELSEQRGSAVRQYLTQSGIPEASVTSKGFGKSDPVASNDTSQGRQQNRRVELVISGDVIGSEIGSPIATR